MQPELLKPIFIIGLHRTGSTFLKNILNLNSAVAMATDEIDLINPWRPTFKDQFKNLKKRSCKNFPEQIVNLIFNGNIYGTFWKDFRRLNIPKRTIQNRFETSDGSLNALLSILLDEYRSLENKKRVGVKYPLHFSRADLLKKWFPDTKIIFLYRDARAVCASKVNDEATVIRKKKAGMFAFAVHYLTLGLFIFDYTWSARYFIKNKNLLNLFPVCYEKFLLNPEKEVNKICDFCEIPFEKKMLTAYGKPSSHDGKIKKGVDTKRISVWKRTLSNLDTYLITIICKHSMKKLGYTFKGLDINC